MDKVITEIIIGAVILSLLISIIPIYRNSAALVSAAGEKADVNENIKEVSFGRLPEDGDVVSGRYLLEVICFLKEKYTIKKIELVDMFPHTRHVESVVYLESKKDYRKKKSYGSDYAIFKEKNRNSNSYKNICDTHIDGA